LEVSSYVIEDVGRAYEVSENQSQGSPLYVLVETEGCAVENQTIRQAARNCIPAVPSPEVGGICSTGQSPRGRDREQGRGQGRVLITQELRDSKDDRGANVKGAG
jgi:hypothetical protein